VNFKENIKKLTKKRKIRSRGERTKDKKIDAKKAKRGLHLILFTKNIT